MGAPKKTAPKKTTAAKKVVADTPEAKVAEIEKAIIPLQKEASAVVIKSEEDFAEATTLVAKVKGYINRVTEVQEFFTNPHKKARADALTAMRKIEALFAPKLVPLEAMEKSIKRAMSDYRIEQENKTRAEEKRLQDIRDKANEKREEEGKGQILTPVKSVERPMATMKTEQGNATMKKTWKHETTDRDALYTDKAFLAKLFTFCIEKGHDEQVLRAMVKEGVREVAGVRIYEDFDVSVAAY